MHLLANGLNCIGLARHGCRPIPISGACAGHFASGDSHCTSTYSCNPRLFCVQDELPNLAGMQHLELFSMSTVAFLSGGIYDEPVSRCALDEPPQPIT